MVPLTSYFVDQSNQCNGSSELQRFNPKNWVVFTHSFLQCIFALVEISKLKSRVGDGLSTLQQNQNSCIKSDVEIAAFQQQFSTFQQNVSEVEQSVAVSLHRNVEQLLELRQNLSQLHSEVQQQLSTFLQNVSEADESIVTYVSLNSEELSELKLNLSQLHSEVQQLALSISSCAALPPSSPSGYYWVRASNGSVVRVYCDMTLSCGNITGGWMRVAELNMTDTSQQCPSNLVERSNNNIQKCETVDAGCSSTTYSTLNINYNKVCGRITGYQVGTTNAFRHYYRNPDTIDSTYVDGVSLTHGNPREHIWTFAAGLDRNGNVIGLRSSYCPCRLDVDYHDPPPFVGEDYFCDAGNVEFMTGETGLETDPLWDGTDCLCCANPPWFYRQLPQPTTDDIEMRVCRDEGNEENIGIQEIEIYIQ